MSRDKLLLTLLALSLLAVRPAEAQTSAAADVVVVEMKEASATKYVFEPTRVEVAPGQTIRFVQQGVVPHNVEFKEAPSGAALDGIRMGPFLMTKGEIYDVRIDERFTAGSYDYICTPHEMMGMKGTIVVNGDASPAGSK